MSAGRTYRIGEVARATGVTVEALRFYEREDLLPTPLRSAGGARRYDDEVLGRVRFIKQAQAVGLTLRDIHVLVKSRRIASRGACEKIRTILAQRIEEIEHRVEEMQAFREILRDYVRACDGALRDQVVQDCPTIDAIERSDRHAVRGSRR